MKAGSIFTLIVFFIAASFQLEAQTDPFGNKLTASSDDSNTTVVEVEQKAQEEIIIQNVNAQEILLLQEDQPYQTVLLDIRSQSEYNSFKIKGARWMGKEFSAQKVWMLHRNSTIILYANTFTDDYVEDYCKKLHSMGFEDVRAYAGGIIDWINNGNAVVNAKGHKTTKYKFDNRKLKQLVR